MPDIDDNIIIILDTDTSLTSGAIYARPLVQNNGLCKRRENGQLLDPQIDADDGWSTTYRHLQNLCVLGFYAVDAADDIYAWNVQYSQQRSITIHHAEIMFKELRRIKREMAKLDESFGYAESFGSYVARFASTIGCNRFGRKTQQMQPDGTFYRWLNVNAMRRHIPELVKPPRD